MYLYCEEQRGRTKMGRISKQEYLQRQESYERQSNKESRFSLAAIFLVFAISWPIVVHLDKPVMRGSWVGWLWFSCFYLFFVCMAVVLIWLNKRNLKQHGLLCSFCSKPLKRAIVVTTGRCGHCGERIVEIEEQ